MDATRGRDACASRGQGEPCPYKRKSRFLVVPIEGNRDSLGMTTLMRGDVLFDDEAEEIFLAGAQKN
jgi:hypothetical protein